MNLEIFLSILPSALLGSAVGLIGGLLPGFGNLLSMIILFPFIAHWSPVEIFVCYGALTVLSQFVGSLTALYTGVPGEASSMPVVLESKRLPHTQLAEAVAGTAVGSAAAGIIAVTIIATIMPYLIGVSWFYRTEILVLVLLSAAFLVVTFDNNKKFVAVVLLFVGLILGLVGWNNVLSTSILTFGIINLYQGIPIELVLIFLFAMPQLLQMPIKSPVTTQKFKFVWPTVPVISTVMHSLLGFVGGLVPGMTTVLSSQLSYAVSSRQTNDPYRRILASETANNAGAISQLIPLLVIGLPLVASEALTLSMMETRGFIASAESAAAIFSLALPFFVGVSILGLVVSWPLAVKILSLLRANNRLVRQIIICLLLTVVYIQAFNDHLLVFYLGVSLALMPLAWLVRNLNTTALVFGFFISDRILDNLVRLLALYF